MHIKDLMHVKDLIAIYEFFFRKSTLDRNVEINSKSLNKLKCKNSKLYCIISQNNAIFMYEKSYIQFDENEASATLGLFYDFQTSEANSQTL